MASNREASAALTREQCRNRKKAERERKEGASLEKKEEETKAALLTFH